MPGILYNNILLDYISIGIRFIFCLELKILTIFDQTWLCVKFDTMCALMPYLGSILILHIGSWTASNCHCYSKVVYVRTILPQIKDDFSGMNEIQWIMTQLFCKRQFMDIFCDCVKFYKKTIDVRISLLELNNEEFYCISKL